MEDFLLYFEFLGKKNKIVIKAKSKAEAEEKLRKKIIFYNNVPKPKPKDPLEEVMKQFNDIFGNVFKDK